MHAALVSHGAEERVAELGQGEAIKFTRQRAQVKRSVVRNQHCIPDECHKTGHDERGTDGGRGV